MRRYIFASHHKLAHGLKDTVQFLNNYSDISKSIYDINAYTVEGQDDISEEVENLFDSFDENDEVIILTDMMGGSVNQRFFPYISNRVHLITGMNLALAMSLLLIPEDVPLSEEYIAAIVEDCKNQIVYVNQLQMNIDENDE